MARVLLDENVPRPLVHRLTGHDAWTVERMGWASLANGALLDAAEREGFEALVTADRNIRYQQSMAGRRLALVVLPRNRWVLVRENVTAILAALAEARPGVVSRVTFRDPD